MFSAKMLHSFVNPVNLTTLDIISRLTPLLNRNDAISHIVLALKLSVMINKQTLEQQFEIDA